MRAVEPCPELEEGPGPLITGWFRHRRGTVYELRVEGGEEALCITGAHPVWSVGREAWAPAAELEIGERLSGLRGPVRLLSRALRAEPEPVYNLEVEGDHCYRVGDQGLLVHNASCPIHSEPEGDSTADTVRIGWSIKTDQVVRVKKVVYKLVDYSLTRTDLTDPVWWKEFKAKYSSDTWEKGHLIASQFGGSRDPEMNFAAQYAEFNDPTYKLCENRIQKIIEAATKCGGCIRMTVSVQYMSDKDKRVIPYSFRIELEGVNYTLKKAFNVFLLHTKDGAADPRCMNTPENNEK